MSNDNDNKNIFSYIVDQFYENRLKYKGKSKYSMKKFSVQYNKKLESSSNVKWVLCKI